MLPVQPAVRRIGFWNCEMDEDDFLDYIRSVGIVNTDKIELLHLRGQPVRLLTDAGMDWTINWLIDNDVEILLNDSWGQAVRLVRRRRERQLGRGQVDVGHR